MTQYKIIIDQKLIVMQMRNDVSVSELEFFLRQVSVDENFDPSFSTIVDIRGLKTIYSTMASQEIIDSASYILGGAPARSAVIADSFLRVKMIDIANLLCLKNHIEIKGFTHMADAIRWLSLDEEQISHHLLDTIDLNYGLMS